MGLHGQAQPGGGGVAAPAAGGHQPLGRGVGVGGLRRVRLVRGGDPVAVTRALGRQVERFQQDHHQINS